jgi:archaellum component FlaC
VVPAEIVLGTVAAVGAVLTALFGGGLLKQAFTHSNALAIQKHELAQTKEKVEKNDAAIQRLTTDVALQNKDINGFQNHIRKLDMIPEINSKLNGLESLMGYLKEQIKDFSNHKEDK